MKRFERVQQILEQATADGDPGHDGQGRFWMRTLEEFKALPPIYGVTVVETEGEGRGARSGLIKALKGEPPFNPTGFGQMPRDRDPVAPEDIAFIEKWIDDGCPDEEIPPDTGAGRNTAATAPARDR